MFVFGNDENCGEWANFICTNWLTKTEIHPVTQVIKAESKKKKKLKLNEENFDELYEVVAEYYVVGW